MADTFDIEQARKAFPAVEDGKQIFFDNAGGSQVLGAVSAAIYKYLEKTNVQLGATYEIAKQSTEAYNRGLASAAAFINASPDEIGIRLPFAALHCNEDSFGFQSSAHRLPNYLPISRRFLTSRRKASLLSRRLTMKPTLTHGSGLHDFRTTRSSGGDQLQYRKMARCFSLQKTFVRCSLLRQNW